MQASPNGAPVLVFRGRSMPVSGESSFPRHRPVYRSWIHDRGRPSCVSDDAMPRIRDPVPCACPNRLPMLSPSSVSAEALTDADAPLSVGRSGESFRRWLARWCATAGWFPCACVLPLVVIDTLFMPTAQYRGRCWHSRAESANLPISTRKPRVITGS